jgi:hypothetical protein
MDKKGRFELVEARKGNERGASKARDKGLPMRYIVEPKSRGFDVIDTTATPRADGFWCYCVDRERAQVIADQLNEASAREKFLIHPDLARNAKIEWPDVDLVGDGPGTGDRWRTKDDAAETLGLSRAEGRENSMFSNLAPDARALAAYMSGLSEELWCAGWMRDLEFMLWSVVQEEEAYASLTLTLTRDQVAKLKSLSNACEGWIVFRRDTGETFVSKPEWMNLFAAWLSALPGKYT